MGASQSPAQVGGFRVFKINDGGPVSEAGLEVFFDFIMEINGTKMTVDQTQFFNVIQERENKATLMKVYNIRTDASREVLVTPRKWGGAGLLGAVLRYDAVDANQGIRVLDVFANSPAAEAGLQSNKDYLLGTTETMFKSMENIKTLVDVSLGKEVQIYVYNSDAESIREVKLTPRTGWGGSGAIGANITTGGEHRIPPPRAALQAAATGATAVPQPTYPAAVAYPPNPAAATGVYAGHPAYATAGYQAAQALQEGTCSDQLAAAPQSAEEVAAQIENAKQILAAMEAAHAAAAAAAPASGQQPACDANATAPATPQRVSTEVPAALPQPPPSTPSAPSEAVAPDPTVPMVPPDTVNTAGVTEPQLPPFPVLPTAPQSTTPLPEVAEPAAPVAIAATGEASPPVLNEVAEPAALVTTAASAEGSLPDNKEVAEAAATVATAATTAESSPVLEEAAESAAPVSAASTAEGSPVLDEAVTPGVIYEIPATAVS